MKVITANVNGIRAAAKKGFMEWLKKVDADVICLQETKCQEHQLNQAEHYLENYHHYFCDAEKKGYSGVAIYCKEKPDNIKKGLGFSIADTEGRYIQVDFGKLSVASLYLPSGTSGDERQALKYEFLHHYEEILKSQLEEDREYILCGDWNIAHKEIDLKNWKANQKNSGFLPEERAWLTKLFDEIGYVDAFRVVNQEPHQYTWWTYRARAWDNNVGWRIDYHIVTPGLKDKIQDVSIYKDERFSDHAPLMITYNLP